MLLDTLASVWPQLTLAAAVGFMIAAIYKDETQ